MIVTNEIASVTILVPHQRGNEIINQIIPFKVFRQQQGYKAIPLITAEERMMTGLSAELSFRLMDQKIQPETETTRQNIEAINNIVRELQVLRVV